MQEVTKRDNIIRKHLKDYKVSVHSCHCNVVCFERIQPFFWGVGVTHLSWEFKTNILLHTFYLALILEDSFFGSGERQERFLFGLLCKMKQGNKKKSLKIHNFYLLLLITTTAYLGAAVGCDCLGAALCSSGDTISIILSFLVLSLVQSQDNKPESTITGYFLQGLRTKNGVVIRIIYKHSYGQIQILVESISDTVSCVWQISL